MRTIQWKIVLTDDNKIASIENASGIPLDNVNSHLLLIGLLEMLKQDHINKLKVLQEKTTHGL